MDILAALREATLDPDVRVVTLARGPLIATLNKHDGTTAPVELMNATTGRVLRTFPDKSLEDITEALLVKWVLHARGPIRVRCGDAVLWVTPS